MEVITFNLPCRCSILQVLIANSNHIAMGKVAIYEHRSIPCMVHVVYRRTSVSYCCLLMYKASRTSSAASNKTFEGENSHNLVGSLIM